jgi:DNA-directed RNA polymerase I, II, and III subunit RPABC2
MKRTTRTLPPFMNRYERAELLGKRAKAIANGVEEPIQLSAEEIKSMSGSANNAFAFACKELEMGKMPMIVKRFHPDGSYEEWMASELQYLED